MEVLAYSWQGSKIGAILSNVECFDEGIDDR